MLQPLVIALLIGIAAFAATFLVFARFAETRTSQRALALGAAALGAVVTLYLLDAPGRLEAMRRLVAEHTLALLMAVLTSAVAAWRMLRRI